MKYARVFLRGADNPLRWIDVPLGNGSFPAFCVTVRMNGHIGPQSECPVWVPIDEIKYMVEIEGGSPTPVQFFGLGPNNGKPN